MNSLAKTIMIASTLTLSEQCGHHFSHIYTQEPIEVADHSGYDREGDGFSHSMSGQVLSTECCHLKVEFNDQSSV
jgi:hypothetical protein